MFLEYSGFHAPYVFSMYLSALFELITMFDKSRDARIVKNFCDLVLKRLRDRADGTLRSQQSSVVATGQRSNGSLDVYVHLLFLD